jgi:hypothetical protein
MNHLSGHEPGKKTELQTALNVFVSSSVPKQSKIFHLQR